ncbi:hypothetical protein AaE_007324 [Aphanomyces astaci]|uniref:Integrase catalytic domain-containing protein n=1 Tax=Aphanomyces astaci TaxID=112090 RepID=A0A6A5AAX9_APHAT|nr:hypothetical protein AaE_007324 [Aphanomyces astaci]
MTDNAKEYLDKDLRAYCNSLSIEQLFTNVYSPEENCIAEKPNYTIMNKVRCILQASGMANEYWGEALNYVVYTENRSPTKALGGKTPCEALHGRKPNIEHLRSFGCTAFAFIDRPSAPSWTLERPSACLWDTQVNARAIDSSTWTPTVGLNAVQSSSLKMHRRILRSKCAI